MSYLSKKSWVATKLGGLEQNWGCASRPGPKTAINCFFILRCVLFTKTQQRKRLVVKTSNGSNNNENNRRNKLT